ncbi:MAG TPA: fatty acid--CoA ligase family protein [Terriglobales bacterium]|nr:fatty acid--CoA ligase family protein [Terriglobales bacterium]
MTATDFILERIAAGEDQPALFWRGQAYDGNWLVQQISRDRKWLEQNGVGAGSVVLLKGDYAPRNVSLLLALIQLKAIIAPLLPSSLEKNPTLTGLVNPSFHLGGAPDGEPELRRVQETEAHPLIVTLRQRGEPGLILFTSGSTGKPKGVVHDFGRLLMKFQKRRPAMRTLNFLLFDHWGGLNTLLHCLSNNSAVVLPETRTPDAVCQLLEQHQVELLPASPTFLNLLLLSKAYVGRDLSSLRLITYGAEPMPGTTLAALRNVFPNVELRQTYGLIELGVLRAKSMSSDSLFVKVGGEGYDLRVVDGILQIKADSAMLGYLNAPSPFTEDGYFITGDRVELNGEYMRFLGRDSELINVGGQKVFPAEVEAVLLECDLVGDAVVYGQANPITGKIVCADVQLRGAHQEAEARRAIRKFCSQRLEPFKVPVKIRFVDGGLTSDRLKRLRIGRETSEAETT